MKQIYEKFINGEELTDRECKLGALFFSDLGNSLRLAGPVFSLAAKEATRVGDQLSDYVDARKGKLWPRR